MVKIKARGMLLLLAAALIAISGCAKPQCSTSADCPSRICTLAACSSGRCAYTIEKNCCGNGINDTIEDGKPGNKCTCPQDYGKCEGKAKVSIGSRTQDATYLHYYCNPGSQCVLGIEKKDISPQNFLDSVNTGYFKASSIIKYNKPFDAARDNFELLIVLEDATGDLVLPVRLTNIKLLLGVESSRAELLIADKDLDNTLNGIGDEAAVEVPLNLDFKPESLEEPGSIRYVIDYTYTKRVLSGRAANGTSMFSNQVARETFTSPSKPVFFVRTG